MTDQSKPERLRELADNLEEAEVENIHGYSAVLLGQKLGEAMEALREYADLLDRPQEATGIYESAWVIEGMWSSTAYPEYWVGSSAWSSDPYKALRFASKESAQQAADMMLVGINHRIACHEFFMEHQQ